MGDDREDYIVEVKPSQASFEEQLITPEQQRKAEAFADWLDSKLGVRFWSVTAVVVASLIFGTPHLLITYHCLGRCGSHTVETRCEYFGIRGWQVAPPDPEGQRCPRVRLL